MRRCDDRPRADPFRLRGPGCRALGAGRLFRHRQPDLERASYQQVLPDSADGSVHGGAYVGVGPDQNFTYIAEMRPAIAFIIDVRRDNLLLHLLFKALFELSRTRIEYLAQLLGRPVPSDIDRWRTAPVDRLIATRKRRRAPAAIDALRTRRRRRDQAQRRQPVREGLSDDRSVPSAVHRGRPVAAFSEHRTASAQLLSDLSPAARAIRTDPAGRGTIWPPKRRSNSSRASVARPDHSRRRRRQRTVGDAAIGSWLTRRGIRLSPSTCRTSSSTCSATVVRAVHRQPWSPAARGQRRRHSLRCSAGSPRDSLRRRSVSQVQSIDDLLDGVAAGKIQYYADLVGR